jgi:hypothetical protein
MTTQSVTGDTLVNASPIMIAIVQSDTTVYSPPLMGLRINAAGTLKVRSGGADHTLTCVAAEYMAGEFDMVYATTTDIADADLKGYQRA